MDIVVQINPVKDLKTGRVYISSQNHGYVVDETTLDPNVAKPAFENVNDLYPEDLHMLPDGTEPEINFYLHIQNPHQSYH